MILVKKCEKKKLCLIFRTVGWLGGSASLPGIATMGTAGVSTLSLQQVLFFSISGFTIVTNICMRENSRQ